MAVQSVDDRDVGLVVDSVLNVVEEAVEVDASRANRPSVGPRGLARRGANQARPPNKEALQE